MARVFLEMVMVAEGIYCEGYIEGISGNSYGEGIYGAYLVVVVEVRTFIKMYMVYHHQHRIIITACVTIIIIIMVNNISIINIIVIVTSIPIAIIINIRNALLHHTHRESLQATSFCTICWLNKNMKRLA